MEELKKVGIAATGTTNINRKGISNVVQMQAAVMKGKHPRATGYTLVRRVLPPLMFVGMTITVSPS